MPSRVRTARLEIVQGLLQASRDQGKKLQERRRSRGVLKLQLDDIGAHPE
jgi:hypothetical protein